MTPRFAAILHINYQEFDVEQNMTTIGWNITSESNCGDNVTFLLQGHTLQSYPQIIIYDPPLISRVIRGSLTAQIPSDELSTVNSSIVYRVVALDGDGNICSDTTSQELFVRFNCRLILSLCAHEPRDLHSGADPGFWAGEWLSYS